MSEIRFRIAKPSDAKQIANCHWHVRERYTQGIFLSLGEGFLRTYYRIILDDPWEVVICAEKGGRIVGFSSATIDGRAQAENLRKHKVRLGLAAAKAIVFHPSLFKEVWLRYKSLRKDHDGPKFVTVDGVRGEYWCWRKDEDSMLSAEMDHAKGHILYDLGYRECFFEVDKFNKQVYKFHIKVNKAQPVEEIELPDGRVRVLFKSTLKPGKQKEDK